MADFVLVHGAWHGAWCWRKLMPLLRTQGHRVFAVSLTGLGDRAHQLSADIRLATHVQDVVAVIQAEELSQVVLVGHSYGGMLMGGVVDQVPQRIAHLVYLDAIVPRSSEAWSSFHDPERRNINRAHIAQHGHMATPDPLIYALNPEDEAWVRRRLVPQPGGVYDDVLTFDTSRIERLPRTFIDCNQPAVPGVAMSRIRVREEPGWQVIELATGHDAMVSAPQALAEVLIGLTK
jgi:pimeloyl-ACP methyl ester carboxylesterase